MLINPMHFGRSMIAPTIVLNNLEYFDTLKTYLLHERDIPKTSEALIIHRTTLLYRLKKIQSQWNLNLEDPWQRLYLMLSLWILEQQNQ